jgi:hypothetical protein
VGQEDVVGRDRCEFIAARLTFEGADAADLEARRRIAAAAIPVPDGVTQGVVRLTDERRFDVPVLLVCPEFTSAQAQEWIRAGDVRDLA